MHLWTAKATSVERPQKLETPSNKTQLRPQKKQSKTKKKKQKNQNKKRKSKK